MNKTLPKISYCIITYNEEKNIEGCLKSIFSQNYPKDKLEIILVDDKSTDGTVEIARKYPVKILYNGKKNADLSVTIGFNAATGEFFNGIGADMQFCDKNWFKNMVKPLIENPDIPVAFTRYYSHPKESLITKYLNLDSLQRDLVYQTFSINFDKVITEKKKGYYLCKYSKDKIPPQSHGLYRVSIIKEVLKKQKIYYDMGNLIQLVNDGYTKFAYVPEPGYYHFHARNIKQLLGKRMRNITRSYLRYSNLESHFKWLDFDKKTDVFKLILLLTATELILPLFLFSLFRTIKHKNWLYLLDTPVTFLLINTILYTFLRETKGRQMVKQSIIKALKI